MGVDRSVRTGKTLFKSIRSKGEGVGECGERGGREGGRGGGGGGGDLTTAVEAEENGLPLRLLRRRAHASVYDRVHVHTEGGRRVAEGAETSFTHRVKVSS